LALFEAQYLELAGLIRAWSELAEPIKAGILALVKAPGGR
jgi:hypothetical protein